MRRGIGPGGPIRPGLAPAGRNRFRLLIDGRPVNVMVAETDNGYELDILGQGRRTPELIGSGLAGRSGRVPACLPSAGRNTKKPARCWDMNTTMGSLLSREAPAPSQGDRGRDAGAEVAGLG